MGLDIDDEDFVMYSLIGDERLGPIYVGINGGRVGTRLVCHHLRGGDQVRAIMMEQVMKVVIFCKMESSRGESRKDDRRRMEVVEELVRRFLVEQGVTVLNKQVVKGCPCAMCVSRFSELTFLHS